MYEYMIQQYIKTLTTEDIIRFANQKGVSLTQTEASILLQTAKEHWPTFYKGDPTYLLEDLKTKINPLAYQFGLNLYHDMKKKITTPEL